MDSMAEGNHYERHVEQAKRRMPHLSKDFQRKVGAKEEDEPEGLEQP